MVWMMEELGGGGREEEWPPFSQKTSPNKPTW